MQPGGAGEVPARRGDAALVLLFRGGKGLRGGRRGRQFLRDRGLGIRLDPDVEPAPGNRRLAQERAAGAGRDRQGPARWARRPSASATTSEAVAAYYEDFANRPERARQLARAKAYEALAAKYPDDDEAQIFYALYLAGTQLRVRPDVLPRGSRPPGSSRSSSPSIPNHPGVAHYLIHSYDAPPIAQQGMPAARLYAQIAPDAPHALHMPSHIFTRVGAWADSAATNRRSADAAKKSNDPDDALHALDYMTYAYLQLARDGERAQDLDEARTLTGINPARAHRAVRARGDAGALRGRARRLGRCGEARAERRATFRSPRR